MLRAFGPDHVIEPWPLDVENLSIEEEQRIDGLVLRGRRLLGEIVSCHDAPHVATAEAHYSAAIALASELGMRPLVAHCHLGLGKLYRRTGQRDEAREHLATVATMYREMDMRFWLEQAEATMRELA